MKAYLTLLGRSKWALINSYYAVQEEKDYRPDKVIIYNETKSDSTPIPDAITTISKEYGFTPKIEVKTLSEGDFIAAGNTISSDLKQLKQEGYETALDITPGRKALVAGAILSATKQNIDHIYYLMIDSTDEADKPYPLIPRKRQTLIDFAEDVRRHPQ
jgi:hypothetical protein